MGDLQEDQSSRMVIINIITLVIAILAVILRPISGRLSAATFWRDDGLIVVALFLNFGSLAFNFTGQFSYHSYLGPCAYLLKRPRTVQESINQSSLRIS